MPSDIKYIISKHWKRLLIEYEQVKAKKHPHFKTCKEFYEYYETSARQVTKYYHRWQAEGGRDESLLPRKRGPRIGPNRIPKNIERDVVRAYRKLSLNRYGLVELFKPKYGPETPSATSMYNIIRKYQRGMPQKAKEAIKRYEKSYPGEMGHMDTYYLPLWLLKMMGLKRGFLVSLLDDCTRLVYTEHIPDITSATVAGFLGRSLAFFYLGYGIRFERILTDNGSEFVGREFQFLTQQIGIKHSRTMPYRPQTNGKVEAYWKILHKELIQPHEYHSLGEFEHNLHEYVVFYNNTRKHGGLKYITPWEKYLRVYKIVTEILD